MLTNGSFENGRRATCYDCGAYIDRDWLYRYKQKPALCVNCFFEAVTSLLESIPPETPEEIDAELRAAGLDPEKIGRECEELAKRLLAERIIERKTKNVT